MKKYIGYLVAFIICICWSFIKCTDDRPIGTFVVKPKYDGEIIFTIREDGQVKYEQEGHIDYGNISNYRDGYSMHFKYGPNLWSREDYLYIKDGYIYNNVNDFISEHPTRRYEFKEK